LDLEFMRAVGASVFRQLFAQLSSDVSHFAHPYYFETSSCSMFYPACVVFTLCLAYFLRELYPTARSPAILLRYGPFLTSCRASFFAVSIFDNSSRRVQDAGGTAGR
jgi:hypothetical protein